MQPRTILLIEDNQPFADAVKDLLQQLWIDITVYHVSCLRHAVMFLQKHHPSMVITDLYIPLDPVTDIHPEMVPCDLTDFTGDPRVTMHTVLDHVPWDTTVVAMSGYMTPLEGQEMLRLGSDGFLAKGSTAPLIQRELLEAWFRAEGRQARLRVQEPQLVAS